MGFIAVLWPKQHTKHLILSDIILVRCRSSNLTFYIILLLRVRTASALELAISQHIPEKKGYHLLAEYLVKKLATSEASLREKRQTDGGENINFNAGVSQPPDCNCTT